MPIIAYKRNEKLVSVFEIKNKTISHEQIAELEKFNDEKVSSMEIKFKEGVTCKNTHDLSEMEVEQIESITLNLI